MKQTTISRELGAVDKLLVVADSAVWGGLFRVAIGFVTIPAMLRVHGDTHSGWALVPFLLAVLLMLRVIPAALRRLLPFSDAVLQIWGERRQIAKRHDSYQWQKLLWIGTGLALYVVFSGQFFTARIAVASMCLLAGTAGFARWRAASSRLHVNANGKQTDC
jgi:hypothetical protein